MKFLLAAINAKYIHSNPGIYSLKAYAEQEQTESACVQVELAEYTINHQMEQILADIYRRSPDIVGLSCYIWNLTYVLELVHDLHKVLPDTDIWVGGPEVSYDAVRLLKQEPEILGVMKGEGEVTFSGLVQCYELLARGDQSGFWNGLDQLSGIAFRDENGEIRDRKAQPVMDMSRMPFLYPDLERFEHRIIYYESSRGCPFSCSYCLSSIDKSVRFRDLKLVKQELAFFLERKVPQVKFIDRTFNCKKSHAVTIWKYILEHDNGVTNFHFEIAADLLDQEEIELLKQMRPGLVQLEIGVQSTNPQTLEEIRRRTDLNRLKQVVAQINEGHNVHQHLDLIVGLPYEDFASFRRSFNEVYDMRPEQLQMGFLKVLKGSYMYEQASQYGLVYRQLPPYEVLYTRWISFEQVLRLKQVEEMLEVYYNSGQFTRTLELLEQEFADAFSMYEALACYYEEQRLNGRSHSRMARYEILHDFISGLLKTGEAEGVRKERPDLADYEDALMCDLYLRENIKSRPTFAPDQAPYKEKVRRLMPQLRSLGTQVHVEVMQSGEIWLFDYRRKDPLTNNAVRTRLSGSKLENEV